MGCGPIGTEEAVFRKETVCRFARRNRVFGHPLHDSFPAFGLLLAAQLLGQDGQLLANLDVFSAAPWPVVELDEPKLQVEQLLGPVRFLFRRFLFIQPEQDRGELLVGRVVVRG